MKKQEFNAYKARFRDAIRDVLRESTPGRLDEAAFPAYSHPNPFINWLFWQRLRKVIDRIDELRPCKRVLDFGCGSGVMLAHLSQASEEVYAMDVDLLPAQQIQARIPFAENVTLLDATKTSLDDLPSQSFDAIIALDVLEHVADLPATVTKLVALLVPGAQLIVSGPTENVLYRIGRKLAGPEYSGAYHECGIAEVKREIARVARIEHVATLYWYMPLFEIFSAVRNPGT